jgi:hypothetical protein
MLENYDSQSSVPAYPTGHPGSGNICAASPSDAAISGSVTETFNAGTLSSTGHIYHRRIHPLDHLPHSPII